MTFPDHATADDLADGANDSRKERPWMRAFRWSLTLGMIAAGIVWILYVPYDPEAVWRALPADVVYFSRHEQAAWRRDALLSNPLTMTIFRSVGIDPETLHAGGGDPETEVWIERLFGRDVLLGYLPELTPGGESAWVFASWIGNRSQRLRWMLAMGSIDEIQPIQIPGQPMFWRWVDGLPDHGNHISLALVDGLLLGAVSPDPEGVRYLSATWNRQAGYPALGETAWRTTAGNLAGDQASDWGAYALRHSDGPDDSPTSLFAILHQLEPAYAAGEVIGSFHVSATARVDPEFPPLGKLAALLDDAPVLWTLMSPALLTSLTRQPYTPQWAMVLAQALSPPGAESEMGYDIPSMHDEPAYPLFLGVLDERFAGSIRDAGGGLLSAWIRRLTVPAVVAGLHVGDEATADAVFMNILDQLNRAYRLGLIPRRAPGESVTVIEDTRPGDSFYDQLLLNERVGVVYHDGWLLFAGQASVLERLIQRGAGRAATPFRNWLPPPEVDPALAYCWVDMEGFGVLAHDALAALSLVFLVRDPHGSLELRRGLADAQAWIQGLRAFQQGRIWVDGADSRFNLKFKLGVPATLE